MRLPADCNDRAETMLHIHWECDVLVRSRMNSLYDDYPDQGADRLLNLFGDGEARGGRQKTSHCNKRPIGC